MTDTAATTGTAEPLTHSERTIAPPEIKSSETSKNLDKPSKKAEPETHPGPPKSFIREYFESGIKDMALGEVMYPGVLQKILTNPVNGLDNFAEMMRLLVEDNTALKVFVNVADE